MKIIKHLLLLIIFPLFIFSCGSSLETVSNPQETLLALSNNSRVQSRAIYVIGGALNNDGTGTCNQIDMYDPQTNTWYPDIAAGASGTYVPTIYGSAAYMDGNIYVFGGAVNSGTTTFAVYKYNIASNSWTSMSNISFTGTNTATMDMGIYTNSNYIYLMGGTTTTTTAGVVTNHMRFNPTAGTSGTWYNTPPGAYAAPARSSLGVNIIGGVAYYCGGRIAAGTTVTTNTGYIIATNLYTGALTVIVARGGMATASYVGTTGAYIFIVGGYTSQSTATAYFSTTPTYVAQASSFQIYPEQGAAVTNGIYHPAFSGGTTTGICAAAAVVSNYNGSSALNPTLYVFGGWKNQSAATTEVWAMAANATLGAYPTATWVSMTPMPRARQGHCVVVAH